MEISVPLNQRIRGLRRRTKVWFIIDGLSRLIVLLLLYLALTFWIDYLIRDIPLLLRLSFLVGGVCLFCLTLFRRIVLPLIRLSKISDDSLVFLIERQFPELKERLINLWQLARDTLYGGVISSELGREVIPITRQHNFSQVFSPLASRKLLLGALVLLFLSILSFTFYPSDIGIWGSRLLGSQIPWPKRTLLSVEVIPDYIIAKGQDVSVIVTVKKGPRLSGVYLRTRTLLPGGELISPWERMLLTRTQDQQTVFRYDFTKVLAPFSIIVKGGDDQTDWQDINVLDAPGLTNISIAYEYPRYTGLSDKTESGGNIKAPMGTKVTISATCNTRLKEATCEATAESRPSGELPPLRQSMSILAVSEANLSVFSTISSSFTVQQDGKYTITLLSDNGLKNTEPLQYQIKAIPDKHPIIKVIEPTNEIFHSTPEATIPLKALISDDYGISDAWLTLTKATEGGGKEVISPTLLPSPEIARISNRFAGFILRHEGLTAREPVELFHKLLLSAYNLNEGEYLTLNFSARDNCELPASQLTTSADYTIIIMAKAQMEKKMEDSLLALKDELRKTLQIQKSAEEVRDIYPAVSNQRRVTQNTNSASSRLEDIISTIQNNKLFSTNTVDKLKKVTDTLRDIGERKSPEVSRLLEEASAEQDFKNNPDQKRPKGISDKQQEIAGDLKQAIESLEEWEDYQEVVNSVRELLRQSENISERLKSQASADNLSAQLEKERILEYAKNLQNESEELEKKIPRVADKLRETHPYYADKLLEALKRLNLPSGGLDQNFISLISNISSLLTGQAIKDAQNIKSILSSLLDFLEERITPQEIAKKIEELSRMLDKVKELKNDEAKILEETSKIIDPSEEVSKLAEQLDTLLLDQKALNEITNRVTNQENINGATEILNKLAHEQNKLKEQAQKLSESLKATADNQSIPLEDKPLLKESGQKVKESADKMSSAVKNLPLRDKQTQEDPSTTTQEQKDALQKLRQARELLQKHLERQLTKEEKRKLEKLAQRQKDLKEETDKTEEKADDRIIQDSLQRVSNKMAQAQNDLSSGNPREAQYNEQEALEELERLYEMLADQRDELKKEKKQKTVEQLYTMLKQVIEHQRDINNLTSETFNPQSVPEADPRGPPKADSGGQENFSREDIALLRKIASEQIKVSDECVEIKKQIDQEESVVFSWTLNNLVDDMKLVAKLLRTASSIQDGDYIQNIQSDIMEKLKELLKSLEDEKTRRKPLQVSQEQMDKMKEKLLPLIAELKMGNKMQENLMARTESIRRELELLEKTDDNKKAVLSSLLQRLASEQGHLAEMVKNLSKLIEKQLKETRPVYE
ncbi:MAG: DUF4175 family protein [Planctomycetota bacterium]|nr:DUF4175 family protein [Planctomycetota bacterium]MDI6787589.1 DUF4175 family protein [Planctomycetota bacterium]